MKTNTRMSGALWCGLLVASASANAIGATWYVAPQGDDANPGTQASPFRTIQHAITAASNGDTIQTGAGTYAEHVNWSAKSLTLLGVDAGQCVIDGVGTGTCLTLTDVPAAARIEGLTFQNGNSSLGGGIMSFNSSPTVTRCAFVANFGTGGGIYNNTGSAPVITHCTFTGNRIGGMYNYNCYPTVRDCTFTGTEGTAMSNINSSFPVTDCTFTDNGRGMYNANNNAIVTRCTFTGCSISGMVNFSSSPTVSYCIFDNNGAGGGGGISNTNGSNPWVSYCIFRNNYATDVNLGGAGLSSDGGNPTVINCTFHNNTAAGRGGAMYHLNNRPVVLNCIFRNNYASGGGGGIAIYNNSRNVTITNCTFSDNLGAAVWNFGGFTSITNCILWGNSSPFLLSGGILTVSHSNVQGGHAGAGNINADPLFVNPTGGEFRLQSASPCIDAGTAAAPGLPAIDMEGIPRVLGSAPDMGTLETPPAAHVWYVDAASGSDSNTGAAESPFLTVTRATTLAVNGNSIYIKQGGYGADRPRMTKALRLFNWDNIGSARIGQP